MTGDAAARALQSFVTTSRATGARSLLVITGRGLRSGVDGPVVKERVIAALASPPLAGAVLAFSTAPPSLGGAGALLVLLRRR
jgi:DNA-nicking Smr family endonuclease